jgi:hypothetical protein
MRLRTALTWISLLATLAGGAASLYGCRLFPFTVFSGIVFVSLLIERWRYDATAARRQPDETATGERFIDPGSGKVMEVVYNESTGERKYIEAARDGMQ